MVSTTVVLGSFVICSSPSRESTTASTPEIKLSACDSGTSKLSGGSSPSPRPESVGAGGASISPMTGNPPNSTVGREGGKGSKAGRPSVWRAAL